MTQMLVEIDARTATLLKQRAQVSGLSIEAMASQLLQKAIALNNQEAQVQDASVTANWLSSIRAKVQAVDVYLEDAPITNRLVGMFAQEARLANMTDDRTILAQAREEK